MRAARERLKRVEAEAAAEATAQARRAEVAAALSQVQTFAAAVRSGLKDADPTTQREVLCAWSSKSKSAGRRSGWSTGSRPPLLLNAPAGAFYKIVAIVRPWFRCRSPGVVLAPGESIVAGGAVVQVVIAGAAAAGLLMRRQKSQERKGRRG